MHTCRRDVTQQQRNQMTSRTTKGPDVTVERRGNGRIGYAGSVQSHEVPITDCRIYASLTFAGIWVSYIENKQKHIGTRKHVSSDDSLELNMFSGEDELQILQLYNWIWWTSPH